MLNIIASETTSGTAQPHSSTVKLFHKWLKKSIDWLCWSLFLKLKMLIKISDFAHLWFCSLQFSTFLDDHRNNERPK